MQVSVIASGSNGNCCLIEKKDTAILIDAGKSGREIEYRMNALGKSLENVDATIITHAHHDHICGAGVISRRYGIPVYMTDAVHEIAAHKLGSIKLKKFDINKAFKIKSMRITPVPTLHNTASCGFVIDKFGLFTDTGIVTKEVEAVMPRLTSVLLESNHDIDMLVHGPYPYHLKQWILSDEGHLSNIHASQLIEQKGKKLQLALLGHLSGNNNTPEVARSTFETLVKRKIDFKVCSRDTYSGSWDV